MRMKTNSLLKTALLSGLLLLVAGCSVKNAYRTRYYLLDYVPTPSEKRLEKGPYPYNVRIRDFRIAEAYKRNQIVYRKSAHELNFYNYELWAVKPEYLVTDMVFKHLQAASIFKNISKTIEQEEPDFILVGEVHAIEEYDNKDEWYAHLSMTMKLINLKDNSEFWRKNYDFRKKVAQQEAVYVVREMSVILEAIVEDMVAELELAFDAAEGGAKSITPAADSEGKKKKKSYRLYQEDDSRRESTGRGESSLEPDPLPGSDASSNQVSEQATAAKKVLAPGMDAPRNSEEKPTEISEVQKGKPVENIPPPVQDIPPPVTESLPAPGELPAPSENGMP